MINKPLKILYKGPFGSHLYGTNTATSDYDYRAIYQPDICDLVKGKHIESSIKDDNGNIDGEINSIHKWLELTQKGNTMSFDLLFTDPSKYDISSFAWDYIVENRSKFYSKKMMKFIGYARNQAVHYSDKNDRLFALNSVKDYLNTLNDQDELYLYIEEIENLYDGIVKYIFVKKPLKEKNHENFLVIMNSNVQLNTKIEHVKKTVESKIQKFNSHRVTGEKGLLDYKAMSHAYRVAVQLKHLEIDGKYSYPLPETKTIMDIKLGKLSNEEIISLVEVTIDETAKQVSTSYWLPDEPDYEFWDDFLIKLYQGKF